MRQFVQGAPSLTLPRGGGANSEIFRCPTCLLHVPTSFHSTRASYWISATSRSSRACAPAFRFLEKMLRPSPPTLRDARNGEQSLDLFSISSVNSKYVSNRQIVHRSFDRLLLGLPNDVGWRCNNLS